MEEVVIFPVAERIIKSLAPQAVRKYASMLSIQDEISRLQDTISTIQDILLDAEKEQASNGQIRDWLERLEHVVYDADEFVDYLSTEALQLQLMMIESDNNMVKLKLKRQVCTLFSCLNQLVFRFKMARELNRIRDKLVEIFRDGRSFRFKERHEETRVSCNFSPENESYLYDYVIGRESDKNAILKRILDPEIEKDLRVVAIVGLGGVGKTTLAKCVFNDEMVQRRFELRMWVNVTDFDLRSVLGEIVQSASGNRSEHMEIDQLVKEVQKEINGKRYLLVLDDVWNIKNDERWRMLENVLSLGAQGSGIIITTRYNAVAKITSTMEPYMLGMLDEHDSWSLFKRVAFREGQEPNKPHIVETGKNISNKCGGNPLAIRNIGCFLYFLNPKEWPTYLTMEFSKIPASGADFFAVLKLSFDYLPSHLKLCFAFCCLFPKECEIDVQTLINFWMAQGFIYSSNPSKHMKDVGYEYFHELLSRSFFQDVQKDKHGMFTKCKMHSLIHDLAIQVAGRRYKMLPQYEDNIDTEVHHLSFNFHLDSHWKIPASLVHAKSIRTILLSNQLQWETEGRSSRSICGHVVLGCKRLRALDLHNSGINIVPHSIGKLKHLRYLDLSHNMNIKTLPSSITKLYHLQTLKLKFCQKLQELPRHIKKLINLINLEIDGCDNLTHMPCGLGKLTDLRTLSQFVLSKKTDLDWRRTGGLDELQNLNSLRGELKIKNLRHGADYEVANLKEKQLQSLILIWNNDDLEAVDNQEMNVDSSLNGLEPHISLKELSLSAYGGVEFPKWFSSLTNLVRVSLWRCKKCRYIPPLDQFSSLAALTLDELTNLEYISKNEKNQLSSTEILPSLKELRLTDLPNLKGWWRQVENEGVDGASSSTKATILLSTAERSQPLFRCLSKLTIENCPKLDSMPLYPNLDEVLKLNNSSLEPLRQTMRMSVAGQQIPTTTAADEASTSTISNSVPSTRTSSPLSKLRNLCIVGMTELDFSTGDVIMWKAFESLHSLTFDHLPQLKTIPEGLQQLDNLHELYIRRCDNFEAIPKWIIDLKSLKKLAIQLLPNLTSLPEELYNLTSLRKLEIEDCPKIAQKTNPGQDLIIKFLSTSEPPRIMY
nr:putative disease resistance protein RGA1 isoform X1 [Ziziphus jujuba var. spinosa]